MKHVLQRLVILFVIFIAAGSGYFYWNYKLLLDTVNDPKWIGWDSWDLGKSVDLGWFPVDGNC